MHVICSIRQTFAVATAAVLAAALLAMPLGGRTADASQTYTVSVTHVAPNAPNFYFTKLSSPHNSRLTAYVSYGWNRFRIQSRAGSGNGSTNSCAKNAGWLPNGTYRTGGGHAGTEFDLMNKTWGDPDVQGWVWYLGDRQCSSGTWRTELFIHSQGTSGWVHPDNYESLGCIKISQVDRTYVADMHRNAHNWTSGTLYVQGG